MTLTLRSISLPLLFLATASFAQIVPPSGLAGGRAVDTSKTYPGPTELVRVASNGSGFLAAWSDARYGWQDVVGERFDKNGQLVGPAAVPLYPSAPSTRPGAVISEGVGYAVFGQLFNGTLPTRVEPDGAIRYGELLPSLSPLGGAWNGSRFGVAFRGNGAPMQLRFFDRDLRPLETVEFGPRLNHRDIAAVAAGNGRFLVVWEEWYSPDPSHVQRLRAQMFDDRGRPLTEPRDLVSRVVASSNWSFEPAVSWNGSRFVVVWSHPEKIGGAAVSLEGVVDNSFEIASSASGTSLAWDGHSHLLVWRVAPTHAYEAATLSSNAEVTSRFVIQVDTTIRTPPAVASDGTMFFVIAGERRLAVMPTSTQRVRDLGLVAPAWVAQDSPVITAGGSHLLAAWHEGGTIRASRILPNGMPLAEAGTPYELGSGSGSIVAASAAPDLHLVVWRDQPAARTRAKLIGPNGLREVEIPWMANHPLGVASDGRTFAIAWMEYPGGMTGPPSELVIGTVDQSGGITPRQIAISYFGARVYAFGWTGSEYALVWRKFLRTECLSSSCLNEYEDRITLLDTAGNVKSEAFIKLPAPAAGQMTAVVSRDGVMVASIDRLPPLLRTQKFAFDGTAAAQKPAYNPNRPEPLYPFRLVRTAAGYTLYSQYIVEQTSPMYAPRTGTYAIYLDPDGAIKSELPMGEIGVYGAIHAFGTTWMTYTAPWFPLPAAHDGRIMRAFYKALPERMRAVRR